MAKQSSTQSFTEIKDVREDLVLFSNGTACLVIEAFATNFALLSQQEQNAQIAAYSAFLNSLSFPIQILMLSEQVDITSYNRLLQDEIKTVTTPHVASYMHQYASFVQQLVKQNTVLDKKFYLVLYYSGLEAGMGQVVSSAVKHTADDVFFLQAQTSLHTKSEGIRSQLGRLNMKTKILEKEKLVPLFHALYNPEIASIHKQ